MTIRDAGLFGGRPPTEHPAATIPPDYRSSSHDIDEQREAARQAACQDDEILEAADEATLQRLYAEAKEEAAAAEQDVLTLYGEW